MVLIRLAFLAGIILLGDAARAQTGFSGGNSSFGAGELLGAAMLVTFTGLTIWGFFSGLDALLPPSSLPPQRRFSLDRRESSRAKRHIVAVRNRFWSADTV